LPVARASVGAPEDVASARIAGSFLHSPLLDELKAMEAILARDNAAAAQAALVAAAAGAVHPAFGDPLPDDPVPTAGEREPGEGAGGGAGAGRGAAEGMAGSAGARLDARMTLPLLASLAEEAPAVVIEEGSGSGAGAPCEPLSPFKWHGTPPVVMQSMAALSSAAAVHLSRAGLVSCGGRMCAACCVLGAVQRRRSAVLPSPLAARTGSGLRARLRRRRDAVAGRAAGRDGRRRIAGHAAGGAAAAVRAQPAHPHRAQLGPRRRPAHVARQPGARRLAGLGGRCGGGRAGLRRLVWARGGGH
jgi:hypothetical protein